MALAFVKNSFYKQFLKVNIYRSIESVSNAPLSLVCKERRNDNSSKVALQRYSNSSKVALRYRYRYSNDRKTGSFTGIERYSVLCVFCRCRLRLAQRCFIPSSLKYAHNLAVGLTAVGDQQGEECGRSVCSRPSQPV